MYECPAKLSGPGSVLGQVAVNRIRYTRTGIQLRHDLCGSRVNNDGVAKL